MAITGKYETIFILNPKLSEEETAAMVTRFSDLITQNGGEIEKVDEWGKRRLAYEINDQIEGYYVLILFTANPDFPAELERIYNITEGVMRSIIVKLEN